MKDENCGSASSKRDISETYLCPISCATVNATFSPLSCETLHLLWGSHSPCKNAMPVWNERNLPKYKEFTASKYNQKMTEKIFTYPQCHKRSND